MMTVERPPSGRKGELMTKPGFENDEGYEAAAAARLVDEAQARSGMTRAAMRDALEAGLGAAMWNGPRDLWPRSTSRDREVAVAGRLLLRIARDLGLPLETQLGASSISIVRELLA